jgi:hypothetical protein|tara:strand:- start:519 stop:755 length:237 start_codon:yes stop_codon:yes gene_type:complete
MVRIDRDTYRQDYYSIDFFTLIDVEHDESVRLKRLGVDIIEYEITIGAFDNELLFYLHLYFKASTEKELRFDELFGNI